MSDIIKSVGGNKPKPKFSFLSNARSAGLNPFTAYAGFIAAWLVFFLILTMVPTSAKLTLAGKSTLAVVAWAIIIWTSDALPKAITGLAVPLLLVLSGAIPDISKAFSGYTGNTSFLVIGTFIFAAVMQMTGLDKRIALGMLGKTSKVKSIIGGFFATNIFSALFIPATVARAATYCPVVLGIRDLFKGHEQESKIRKALSIAAIGFSASLGAPLFITAHMPNVVVASVLSKSSHIDFTWTKWLILNWPMIGLSVLIYLWTKWHFGLKDVSLSGGEKKIAEMKEELGPQKPGELLVLACFALAVLLWITQPIHHIKTGMVTLVALMVLFIPGLMPVRWRSIQQNTMWGTWLLLGGSLSLSAALASTGVAKLIATSFFKVIPHWSPLIIMLLVIVIIQIFRLGISSSVAAVTLMAPILVSLAPMLGMNPVPFTLSVAILDPFTFVIPIELASCVVAYGSEDFSFSDFFRAGAPVTAMAIAYVLLIMVPWWSLMGYPLALH